MAQTRSDVNVTNPSDARAFLKTGISPALAYSYQGCMTVGETENPLGEATPVYCPSSERHGVWDIIATTPAAPELGTFDMTVRMDRFLRDAILDVIRQGCEFNLLTPLGRCTRPDNPFDWDSAIIRKGVRGTSFTIPELNPQSGENNEAANLTIPAQYRELLLLRRLVFAQYAESTIVSEVLDGFYYDVANCGDCGTASDGCGKWYWLTSASGGSPGLSSRLVVSIDDKATHFSIDINVLGGLSANRVVPVGLYAVVISQANGGHAYSLFTDIDAQTQAWTLTTSGYVATKGPRAIYSKNSVLTFVAGAGGYIYLMRNPTQAVTVLADGSATVQDLNDIDGQGNTVVAVGNSNAVLYSNNNGDSFGTVVGPAVGVNLTSIEVISDTIWHVGSASGIHFTVNGGTSWTLAWSGGLINDIQFYDSEVGYAAVEIAGVGAILWTIDGGATWIRGLPRLAGVPGSVVRYNVATPCGPNEVAIGGRKTVGGDGILASAS